MTATAHPGQKVTLTDLLSLMAFTTPFFVAVRVGWDAGFAEALAASVVGLAVGVLNIGMFRRSISWLVELPRWLGLPLYFCEVFIMVLVIPGLLFWMIPAMSRQHFVPISLRVTIAVSLWLAVLVWIRSKRIFTKRSRI